MKKLLSILGAIGIVASSSVSVIACAGGGSNKNEIDPYNPNNDLTPTQADTMNAIGSISEVMLAGKTENLGINKSNQIFAKDNKSSGSFMPFNRFKDATSGNIFAEDGTDIGARNAKTYTT
ncbi:hypothetical protein Zmor_003889 [Zophobas morio]|uniref:Uncharacterized protein n=1 Tax=Zophobas morio TaxID=2755281 RepID=A0AA38M004_9CUCU|nr:hypothetical protein Zmor_003889 [Zophobas morio]